MIKRIKKEIHFRKVKACFWRNCTHSHMSFWGKYQVAFISLIYVQGGSSLQLYKSVHSQVRIWDEEIACYILYRKEWVSILTFRTLFAETYYLFLVDLDFHIAQGYTALSRSWLQRVYCMNHLQPLISRL